MIVPKLMSTNILFKDIKSQPKGSHIVIFHTHDARGAMTFDRIHTENGVTRFEIIKDGEWRTVAAFPTESDWFVLDADRTFFLTTEELAEKHKQDEKDLEYLQNKLYPEDKGKKPAPKPQPQIMMMMPKFADGEEPESPAIVPGKDSDAGYL